MEDDEEEEHGPCEWFGLRRIPLKPGTASGYLGVQRTKSKKRPWQATVSRPGKKRVGLGSFKKPIEAAVARANKGLGSPSRPEPTEAGSAKLRFGVVPAPRDPSSPCHFHSHALVLDSR